MIGLVKPIIKNFRKEENMQAAITTVELVRSVYTKGRKMERQRPSIQRLSSRE